MARYSLIANDIWYDECFLNLSAQEQRLYFYLLTSPHCSVSGFYRLPQKTIENDIGESDLILKETHLWKYDKEKQVVLIPSYLKYNKCKSFQQKKALSASLVSLPNTSLIVDFFSCYVRYVDDDFSKFDEELMKRLRFHSSLREDKASLIVNSILLEKENIT